MTRFLCALGFHPEERMDLYTRITPQFEVINANKGICVYVCEHCGKRRVP